MGYCISLAYFISIYLTFLSLYRKTDFYIKDILVNSVGGSISFFIMSTNFTKETFNYIAIAIIVLCYIPEIEVTLTANNYDSMLKIQQIYLVYNNVC